MSPTKYRSPEDKSTTTRLNIIIGDPDKDINYEDCFGAIFQYPGTFGTLRDFTSVTDKLHEKGALVTISADPCH